MRGAFTQFRRAPGRILASVLALALAVGAVGVFAIPTISGASLRAAVARDGVPDLVFSTTPLSPETVAGVAVIDGVAVAEAQVEIGVEIEGRDDVRLVGLPREGQRMDLLQLSAGRAPSGADEAVTSPDVAEVGESLRVGPLEVTVVGHGGTLWWASSPTIYADVDVARAMAPEGGTNRLVVTAVDDSAASLRSLTERVRARLASDGASFVDFPISLPNGSTPIDDDIEQISGLIGLLGVVAGIVALVLLASTTNTLVAERSREVAVMRALGGRNRPLRRRLRRLSMGITVAALAVGLPLGVLISNLIARLVLEEFVGLTPGIAIDVRVLALSAAGALLGARIAAARAARRVTSTPLAEALRDRDGSPYGARRLHRMLARLPLGGLPMRLAVRTNAHRPMRTFGLVAQVAAASGAAVLIATLSSSVNAYNDAAQAPWVWQSVATARTAGLPIDMSTVSPPSAEPAIATYGEIDGWELEVHGLVPETAAFVPVITAGDWLTGNGDEVVVSSGLVDRLGLEVGDDVVVDLAVGPATFRLAGVVDDRSRAVYLDRDELAGVLGTPGHANVVYGPTNAAPVVPNVAVDVETAAERAETLNAGRDAIVLIFGAIGVVVAGVAALAVTSSMAVGLFQRRHHLATLRALGARRRAVRGIVAREVIPLGVVGVALGLGLGAVGARGVIGSFEASEAVDIGVVDAVGAVPFVVLGTLAALLLVTRIVVRSAARQPIAVVLRSAA